MSVVATPRLGADYVPGITRTELPYGLFSVASMRGDADARWAFGATWDALPCDPAGLLLDPCLDEDALPLGDFGADRECTVGAAEPFTVYGFSVGSPIGNGDHEQRALDHLAARAEAAVEAALWNGEVVPSFGDDADEPITGTVGVVAAVAGLEAYIGTTYGSLGVLHMPRDIATYALTEGVLTVKGNRLQTKLGTPVAAGAGYVSQEDGTSYLYSTPALMIYNTPPQLLTGQEAVFAAPTNDVAAVAASTYLVGYDPCGVARALVDPSAS